MPPLPDMDQAFFAAMKQAADTHAEAVKKTTADLATATKLAEESTAQAMDAYEQAVKKAMADLDTARTLATASAKAQAQERQVTDAATNTVSPVGVPPCVRAALPCAVGAIGC